MKNNTSRKQKASTKSQPVTDQPLSGEFDAMTDENSESFNRKSSLKKTKKFRLHIGPEIRSYKYSEPGFVTHEGLLYGGNLEFYQNIKRVGYNSNGQYSVGSGYSLNGQILTGTINYDGSLCDNLGNCVPYQAKTSDIISRFVGKYHFETSPSFSLQIGLGYRHLIDKGQGVGFYLRTGSWFYAPLVIEYRPMLTKSIYLNLSSEFDYIVSGGIKSNLSEVDTDFSDVYMSQTGSGLLLKGGFEYQSFKILLFYETWNLNESGEAESGGLTFVEPKNSSQSLGLQVSYDLF